MFQIIGYFACVALGLVGLVYGLLAFRMIRMLGGGDRVDKIAACGIFLFGLGMMFLCYWASPYQVILK